MCIGFQVAILYHIRNYRVKDADSKKKDQNQKVRVSDFHPFEKLTEQDREMRLKGF
jgi:CTP synthase (UTP-ammonia lyase)